MHFSIEKCVHIRITWGRINRKYAHLHSGQVLLPVDSDRVGFAVTKSHILKASQPFGSWEESRVCVSAQARFMGLPSVWSCACSWPGLGAGNEPQQLGSSGPASYLTVFQQFSLEFSTTPAQKSGICLTCSLPNPTRLSI